MNIDLTKFRPFIDIALRAVSEAGGNSPAMGLVTGALSQFLGTNPQLQGEKVRFDTGLRDAIKARRDAFDDAHEAGKKHVKASPAHPSPLPPPQG